MSNRISLHTAPKALWVLGCLTVGLAGCKSTGSRMASLPGFGWLGSEKTAEGDLADSLPPPSSVASPEPIKPQDEVPRTADASIGREPTAQYPVTQYPAIQSTGVQAASAISRAPAGYETGRYDRKVTSGAPGTVAPPESIANANVPAGGPTQPGMYDADYQDEVNEGEAAGQSTWEGETSNAAASAIPTAPVDDEIPPQQFDSSTPATSAPPTAMPVPQEGPNSPAPASLQSEWVGDISSATSSPSPSNGAPLTSQAPPTQDLGYAANAIAQQSPMDAKNSTRQVNHEEPVNESKPPGGSIYQAKQTGATSGGWRPGSTSSYR